MRRLYLLHGAVLIACTQQPLAPPGTALGPGSLLVGSWTRQKHLGDGGPPLGITSLDATAEGVDLEEPCIGAHFGPLRLDDSLAFSGIGVVTDAAGLVLVSVGDSISIAGRVVSAAPGWSSSVSPWPDNWPANYGTRIILPYDTLVPGHSQVYVCTA
jgi:hypothetical protein